MLGIYIYIYIYITFIIRLQIFMRFYEYFYKYTSAYNKENLNRSLLHPVIVIIRYFTHFISRFTLSARESAVLFVISVTSQLSFFSSQEIPSQSTSGSKMGYLSATSLPRSLTFVYRVHVGKTQGSITVSPRTT